MRKNILTIASLLLAVFTLNAQSNDIEKMLSKIDAVTSYEKLEKTDTTRTYYLMKFRQNLDPKNAEAGTFEQRVMLGHRGYDRPTVIVTEGYGGDYAFKNKKFGTEELARLLDANILFVEYRYFLESRPEPCNWDYLTVENSMYDYHAIVTAFKEFYTKKWAATGISKGGSTTMFYRAYFPEDVDVSVPYVAPLSYALEDGRHESFLERVSTKAKRDAVRNFQIQLFERKERLLPMLDAYCLDKGFTFNVPTSEIYDLCVLEFQFSFWQWGSPVESIPANDADDRTMFEQMIKGGLVSYFARQNNLDSFSVQAVKDFGYYGYNTDQFKDYIKEDLSGYYKRVMLPKEWADVEFDDYNHRFVTDYLTENDPKMIFIYGEWDPWTASGVTWLRDRNKQNIHIYIQPDGSHTARIGSMPKEVQAEILDKLNEWMQYR